ncbi:MAG TPA: methyltransferase domain-containing protein [Stellaceae bacterium]|nr:methyltransferase domain-containing protein [Stellaceae bacterium]
MSRSPSASSPRSEWRTAPALSVLDHFHGRGVAATKELVGLLQPQPGEHLLDIGSGIGGPARWFAAHCGVCVTGIDLTPEFCAAAEALNRATGLADRVTIKNGSALALPVPDDAFDRAYSQNVVMNIADKSGFYREAFRALKPGGRLALSNLCRGGAGEFLYPVPWAETAATSFLATPDEMRADLMAAGFEIVSFEDTTAQTLPAAIRNRERLERDGLGALGTHLIMGERLLEMQINSARNQEAGLGRTIEALVRRPG